MSRFDGLFRLGALGLLAAAGCSQAEEPDLGEAEQYLCSSATASCTCGVGGDAYSNNRGGDGSCSEPWNAAWTTGTPLLSAIEFAGDQDWFRFTTTAASGYYTYSFETNKSPLLGSGDPATDTYCEIYSSPASVYPSRYNNNDTGDASLITGGMNCQVSLTTNLQNTTFYLRVRHASSLGTGPYAVLRTFSPAGSGEVCDEDADCGPNSSCFQLACTAVLPDGDGDGYPDVADNCPVNANGIAQDNQLDSDCDGTGDACDSSSDPNPDCVPAEVDEGGGEEDPPPEEGPTPVEWSGVLQPINADGSSIFKLGRTIPVKFRLTGADAGRSDLVATISVRMVTGNVLGDEYEISSTSAASTGNEFRYDASGDLYIFNLGTSNLSAGTFQISIDLGDGSTNTVNISLR